MKGTFLYLLLPILFFTSCDRIPMKFDKDRWVGSYGEFMLEGNDRYRMMLWLEDHYWFCGKPLDEILDTFFRPGPSVLGPERYSRERIVEEKRLRLLTRQHDPNYIIGIDPWIDTDWIDLYFDDDLCVSKAVAVHRNPRGDHRTEKTIWIQQPINSQR